MVADSALEQAAVDALNAWIIESARQRTQRALLDVERTLERDLGRAFAVQARVWREEWRWEHMVRFSEPRLRFVWEAPFDQTVQRTSGRLLAAVRKGMKRAIRLGHDLGASLLLTDPGAFGVRNVRAERYIEEHGAALVTRINAATREEMRAIVEQAITDGTSPDATARVIIDRFQSYRSPFPFTAPMPQQHIRSRAHLIAMTEVGEAYSQGNMDVAEWLNEAGTAVEKSWITAGDERVDDWCKWNAEVGWIAVGDMFPGGTTRPLQHPACRCDCLYRTAPLEEHAHEAALDKWLAELAAITGGPMDEAAVAVKGYTKTVKGKTVRVGAHTQQRKDSGSRDSWKGIRAWEEQHRNAKIESNAVFDERTGKFLAGLTGDESSAPVPGVVMNAAPWTQVLTHNHPKPYTFSNADIGVLLGFRLAAIRAAIIGDGTVTARPTNKARDAAVSAWESQVRQAVSEAIDRTEKQFGHSHKDALPDSLALSMGQETSRLFMEGMVKSGYVTVEHEGPAIPKQVANVGLMSQREAASEPLARLDDPSWELAFTDREAFWRRYEDGIARIRALALAGPSSGETPGLGPGEAGSTPAPASDG